MANLKDYSNRLHEAFRVKPVSVFAKILTSNDDAGRHGVLVPNEVYGFFPDLPIPDPAKNATGFIAGRDVASGNSKELGWKYYERYPERRITRLNPDFNDMGQGRRLAIFIKARSDDERFVYLYDLRLEERDPDFAELLRTIFDGVPANPGAFVLLPLDAATFQHDSALSELLDHYDSISSRGWIDSLRVGDTGIGYTFETLVGIKENNDQNADYKGIELKCKLKKDARTTGGKINLFQMGPVWTQQMSGLERLRKIGQCDESGAYSCYSQVTPNVNNLGLKLVVRQPQPADIDLQKDGDDIGFWARQQIAKRLAMKHSRAAFIKADSQVRKGTIQYHYNELIYCEHPDIDRFIEMVSNRRIVFEFAMAERSPGRLRNHGYPWRLVDERELDSLFGLQVKLRG